MSKAIYVAMEGLDGCGKTSQTKLLSEYLEKELGQIVVQTREPGSLLNRAFSVRDLLLSKEEINANALELLFQADRAQHTYEIQRLLKKNISVISDRCYISGLTYGIECGNDPSHIKALTDYSIQVRPDVIFYIDVPPEEAIKRTKTRGETETREESKGFEFYKRVYERYNNLFKNDRIDDSSCSTIHCRIDGVRPEQTIARDIQALVNTLIVLKNK